MKGTLLPLLLLLMPVAGCVMPADPTVPFSDSDLQHFRGYGSAAISGHAYLKTGDDSTMSGGGYQVELTPATAYTMERYTLAQKGRSLPPPDPGLAQYVRRTTTDFLGNFAFTGLPPGEYLLSCSVTWEAPAKFQANSVVPMTEQAFATATVAAGDTVKVVLTN